MDCSAVDVTVYLANQGMVAIRGTSSCVDPWSVNLWGPFLPLPGKKKKKKQA